MNAVDALADSVSASWFMANKGEISWAAICERCVTLRNYTLRVFGQDSDEYQGARVLHVVARQRHMDQLPPLSAD